jgi:hypothetical protein
MVSKFTSSLAIGVIIAVIYYQWKQRQSQTVDQQGVPLSAPPTVDSAVLAALVAFAGTWGVLTYMEDDRQAALNAIEIGDPGF